MAADNENANSFLIGSVKSEEVVCILKRPQAPSTYDIFSLKEVSDEQGTSFILSQTPTAEAPAQVFDGLVIDSPPAHLHSSPSQYVHVVVSALSGTGLAQRFYESVLTPLFAAFGLSASEASSPATLPNSYNLVLTQTATSIRDFARGLGERIRNGRVAPAQQQQHTVVLLSGDGGVVEMLNGKAPVDESSNKSSSSSSNETSLPLIALLPLGTGNALFHSLHKTVEPVPPGSPAPSALVQALRTLLLAGRAAPLPSFRVTFPPGSRTITYGGPGSTAPAPALERKELGEKDGVVEEEGNLEERSDAVTHLHGAIVASYGFHAQLVWESDTPAYRRHGAARFGMVAQELLREAHAYRADVELVVVPASSSSSSTTTTTAGVGLGKDKGTEKITIPRDTHAYLLATLVSHLERTFCISPASRPLDGRLRLVHFGPASGDRTMDIMRAAYDGGRHVGMKWGGGDGDGEEEEKGEVGYDEVEELRITVQEEDPRWRKMCIDGTIVEVPAGGTVTVRREGEGEGEGGAHLRVLVDRGVVAEGGGGLE